MRGPRLGLRERSGSAARASWTVTRAWVRRVVLAGVAAFFLAYSGAFGTASVPFLPRFLFWLLGIGVGTAIGGSVNEISERFGWPSGARASFGFVAFATAVPTTLFIWALDCLLFGSFRQDTSFLASLLLPVTLITCAMSGLNTLAGRQPMMTHAAASLPECDSGPPVSRTQARLFDRLPQKLRGAELWAIQAEDHYLRLHTSRGSDLILLRLSDAMAELEGIEGAQTHRSWWVAKSAVESARRADGRATLLLKGGVEAPVSRTYARALREAAWFD